MIMTDDMAALVLELRQDLLDDLLSRWDHWLQPIHVGRGHSTSSAGCGLYRASRQYDDQNGALDEQVEHQVMQGVQACVEKLGLQHRVAIHIEARNVRLGVSVWRSPRLPADQLQARAVIDAARLRMVELLCGAGLMD